MSDADISPERRVGSWVRFPDGEWMKDDSPEHIAHLESLGRKKGEGDSGYSPGAPSPEVDSADKALAEFRARADETRRLKSNNLTDPVKKIARILEEVRKLTDESAAA